MFLNKEKKQFVLRCVVLLFPMALLEALSIYSTYPIFLSLTGGGEVETAGGVIKKIDSIIAIEYISLSLFLISLSARFFIFRYLFSKTQMMRELVTEAAMKMLINSENIKSKRLKQENFLSEVDLLISNYFTPMLMLIMGICSTLVLICLLFFVNFRVTILAILVFQVFYTQIFC